MKRLARERWRPMRVLARISLQASPLGTRWIGGPMKRPSNNRERQISLTSTQDSRSRRRRCGLVRVALYGGRWTSERRVVIGMDERPVGLAALDGQSVMASDPWSRESMAKPTTRRLKASSTTAPQTLPARVGCSVTSVTQRWSGPSRRNLPLTRSQAVRWLGVLCQWGRPGSPAMPLRRTTNSTVRRATVMPRPEVASACTRRAR